MAQTYLLSPTPVIQFFTDAGLVNAGGKVYTYEAGSTTLSPTYSDAAGVSANANPLILDAAGRGTMFLGPLVYKFDVQTVDGVSLSGYPRDNVAGSLWTGAMNSQSTLNPGLNANGFANQETATINKAGSGTHAVFAGLAANIPTIGAGASTLTEATTFYVQGAPTGGSSNYAMHVAAGLTRLDGGMLSNSPTAGGIGYATGAGGTVTQLTNRTTGVTLNTLSGAIVTSTASLAAETSAVFVVTNSTVALGDVPITAQRSGSNGGDTDVYVSAVAAGSFTITVANNNAAGGTAETGAIIINFGVFKAVFA